MFVNPSQGKVTHPGDKREPSTRARTHPPRASFNPNDIRLGMTKVIPNRIARTHPPTARAREARAHSWGMRARAGDACARAPGSLLSPGWVTLRFNGLTNIDNSPGMG